MALHGEIKVNHHIIGFWEAVRTSETVLESELTRYECRVTFQESLPLNPEDPWAPIYKNHDLRFHVWHKYEDGALALGAQVMAEAAHRMKVSA